MVRYGMYKENEDLIKEKAKSKKDGVYTFRGIVYRVSGNRITHFACPPNIIEVFGGLNMVVASIDGGMGWQAEARKILKSTI